MKTINIKKRVLSGVRPTNVLHLGNYLGAVKGMIELQNDQTYETFYMVVDLHALTTPYDPASLKQLTKEVIVSYLSAGLDPEKSVLFVQSMVPQHTELAFYFSTVVTAARMQHLPTYKEKVKQHPEHVTMALLNYPVLMASDILTYKADEVPVGVDQEPHIEVAREIARKMNDTYGTDFPEPIRYGTKGAYIPSLLGEGKMSKSVEGSYITIVDDLETIKSRLAKVPTDSGKGNVVPHSGPIRNLLDFVDMFQGESMRLHYENAYTTTGIRYSDLKNDLAVSIHSMLQPIQEKRLKFLANPSFVDDVINEGAKKASAIARVTLDEVKKKMGLC